MTENALYDRIVRVTRAVFGRPVNPHLFRDCAATALAMENPDHIRIVAPLLGHTNLTTAERFYNQGQAHQAAKRHLIALRKRRSAAMGPSY
jgi:integrase